MIYAVEGNVNVGKTTFISEFAKQNKLNIIGETKFPSDMNPFQRQLYYIDEEVKKCKSDSNSPSIMDRSILSVYLFTLISMELKKEEKTSLISIINKLISNKQIIVPNELIFIIYPFDLINSNHSLLGKSKKTQDILVDYEYYLKYNLFFANKLTNSKKKILNTFNNRQIILMNDNKLYFDLPYKLSENRKVILLDGAPAIGKTTIGNIQTKYTYIPEFSYKKYSLEDYSNQLESIVKRINLLNSDNVIIDTSFLMGITHLFYSHEKKISKNEKITIIEKIMSQVPLYLYTTKIIYLYTNIETLIYRKNSDKIRERRHFNDNMKYLKEEFNFFKKLNHKMNQMSNIYMIEASGNINEIINIIDSKQDKEVLLIDLFYYIIECIKEGEI